MSCLRSWISLKLNVNDKIRDEQIYATYGIPIDPIPASQVNFPFP